MNWSNLIEQLKSFKTPEQIAKKHRLDVSFIKKQLQIGEPIEHEHTKNRELAREIALQHLDEIPDYYTRLKKMEADAKKHHKKFKDVKEKNEFDMDVPMHIKYEKRYCPKCKKEELRHECKYGARYWDLFSFPLKLKEETTSGDQGLHDWFEKSKSSTGKKGWVQLGGKFAGKPCARQPGQTSTPKCGSSKMAANLSPEEEESARLRKNRQDPNQPEKTGAAKPTNVRTEEMDLQEVKDKPGKGSGKKDACYTKVKSRYSVWPSAYASGALVKCRQVGASNWGNKSEAVNPAQQAAIAIFMKKKGIKPKSKVSEACWDGYTEKGMKKRGKKMVPNCVPVKESHIAIAMGKELDDEGGMIKNQLEQINRFIKMLRSNIQDDEMQVPAWVQSKITLAADYLDTAANYMAGKGEEVKESIDGSLVYEAVKRIQTVGQLYNIVLNFQAKTYNLKIYFPSQQRPTQEDVQDAVNKIYPGAIVYAYYPSVKAVDSGYLLARESVDHAIAARCVEVEDEMRKRSKNYLINIGVIGEAKSPAWQRKAGKNPKGGLND
jgi:hypothetical protein